MFSKKYIILILLLLLMILLVCAIQIKRYSIPEPDEIVIYSNHEVFKLKPNTKQYQSIYRILDYIPQSEVQEMSIDSDYIEEIKSWVCIEYVYYDTKQIANRDYSKLLFSLSGWTDGSVILCVDDNYLSGTYPFYSGQRVLKAIYRLY